MLVLIFLGSLTLAKSSLLAVIRLSASQRPSRIAHVAGLEVTRAIASSSPAEKARIIAESLMPGVRVADVARKYGATRWQVYNWRKRLRRQERLAGPESTDGAPVFAAVVVQDAP